MMIIMRPKADLYHLDPWWVRRYRANRTVSVLDTQTLMLEATRLALLYTNRAAADANISFRKQWGPVESLGAFGSMVVQGPNDSPDPCSYTWLILSYEKRGEDLWPPILNRED